MNVPILTAASLVLLALIAHVCAGIREAMSIRPRTSPARDDENATTLERHWVQSLCAFQLVTVDLLCLSAILFAIGGSDWFPARRQWALASAAFFALWGMAWLVQLLVLRRPGRDFLSLGQWALWFACAGLLWWGSHSL